MTENLHVEKEAPPEEEQAHPKEVVSETAVHGTNAAMEALFAEAVQGQERLVSGKKGVPNVCDFELAIDDPSESEEAYEGPRGADPREIYQRVQTLVKEQTEKIMDLEAKLEESVGQVGALRDRLIRNQADSENFRKRMTREREEQVKFGNEKFIREMLSVVDGFELALQSGAESDGARLAEGITMIHNQMIEHLAKYGVEAVDSVGQPFDPSYHEAFQQVPTDKVPPGYVAQQFQKGYLMFGRLLRPARVSVAIAPHGVGAPPDKAVTEPVETTPDATSDDNKVGF